MDPAVRRHRTIAELVCEMANFHDVDRLVDCFTPDYANVTPVHPDRSFRGSDQVRRNWSQIFAAIPDLVVEVVRSDQVGDTVWSEWEMRGTRLDGGRHLMRGVMIFTVDGERVREGRFYLEPVEHDSLDADQAVRQLLRPRQS